ncbi:hypothetical protein EDE04_0657 [Streptomyces sp. 2132.2]|nr:hypothetical protein EDE04_0657 [Streptomyces sp. 2132.2]
MSQVTDRLSAAPKNRRGRRRKAHTAAVRTRAGVRPGVSGQPSMRCWVQNEVRSVVVAAWAAALNSAVVETPYQCEVA